MKIQILSDLHNEIRPYDTAKIQADDADVVVLAGDISNRINGIEWAKRTFSKPVIYVAGNHEHYGSEYYSTIRAMKKAAQGSNVHFLEKSGITIDGYRFLGCTFWTDFNLYRTPARSMNSAANMMSDFSLIRYGDKYFSAEDSVDIHNASLQWLKRRLADNDRNKTIVVTHHLPSLGSVAPIYDGDLLNPAFASNHGEWIDSVGIPLWVHGHTHIACDYQQGDTRIVCNPRGYVPFESSETTHFEEYKIIDLQCRN